MLSIGKLGLGQESYYLSIADGVDDYYVTTETPGQWVGTAARDLGLSGVVSSDDLRAVFAAIDPTTGATLAVTRRRVPGFDLTLSAPKSVSVLYALGTDAVPAVVIEAHERAVEATLSFLEREACFVRAGHNGIAHLPGGGFIAAAFRHRTSRAGDPQLHTHLLVANLACGADGVWRALDARDLYHTAKTAGTLYRAQLRAELSETLGVEWRTGQHGIAEIAGIDDTVLAEFSQRRRQIEQAMTERGVTGPKAAQVATLATRIAKQVEVNADSLAREWCHRALAHGLSVEHVQAIVRVPGRVIEPVEINSALAARLAGDLTNQTSSFDRRDMLRAIANDFLAGVRVADVDRAASSVLASDAVVPLGAIGRYTTAQLLTLEADVLTRALHRRRAGVGVVDDQVRTVTLAAFPHLAGEQQAAVHGLLTSGAGVEVVVGLAGAGKTSMLAAAHHAWKQSGANVCGTALSARAASELEAGTGIRSMTLTRLFAALESGSIVLNRNSVVVCDEAAMVGTPTLGRLLGHAERAGAKVVLVGDYRQLPELEPGGMFAALARDLGAHQLRENRRQHDPVEVTALAALRAGRPDVAVRWLDRVGHVIGAPTELEVRDRMIADWHRSVTDGQTAILLAERRVDVDDLNRRARARFVDEGIVFGPELEAGGRVFAAGDHVAATRNDYQIGLLNGVRGVVEHVDVDARTLAVALADGLHIGVPVDFLDAGHLDYGYCLTIHKAQGMTVDATFVLGDPHLFAEAGYTALSRGRDANHVYVAEADHDLLAVGHALDRELADPTGVLVSALGRSRAQQLGLDLDPDAARVAELATLAPAELRRRRGELESNVDGYDHAVRQLAAAENCVIHANRQLRDTQGRVQHWSEVVESHTGIGRLRTSRAERERARETLASQVGQVPIAEHALRERKVEVASLRERVQDLEHRVSDVADELTLTNKAIGLAVARAVERELADPSPPIVEVLGPQPDAGARADQWRAAVRAVATYRAKHDLEPDRRSRDPIEMVLGPVPNGADRARYRDIADQIARLVPDLARDRGREPPGIGWGR